MTRTPFTLLGWLSFGVAVYAVAAYALLPIGAVLHPDLRPSFAAHAPAVVMLHAFGAAVALFVGPLQFWGRLRRARPGLHRALGTVYLAVGVGVGGLSSLVLAPRAFGGLPSQLGFGLLALAWLATGGAALASIVRGDVASHRRWMTLNFALTFAAVTLRLYLPAAIVGGVPLETAYRIVAWACWVPNVVVALWLGSRGRGRAGSAPRRGSPPLDAAEASCLVRPRA